MFFQMYLNFHPSNCTSFVCSSLSFQHYLDSSSSSIPLTTASLNSSFVCSLSSQSSNCNTETSLLHSPSLSSCEFISSNSGHIKISNKNLCFSLSDSKSNFEPRFTSFSCNTHAASSTSFSSSLTSSCLESTDTNSSVKVAVRVRPSTEGEGIIKVINSKVIEIHRIGKKNSVLKTQQNISYQFLFDVAFGPNASQKEVYEQTAYPLIKKLIEGINGTVFVYGATGAGKTHTMLGTSNDKGIILRTIDDLYNYINTYTQNNSNNFNALNSANYTAENSSTYIPKNEKNGEVNFQVFISYIEVYNETIRDLLNPNGKHCEVQEDNNEVRISNVLEVETNDAFSAIRLLTRGTKNRRMEATQANKMSSRSHAIFQITLISYVRTKDENIIRKKAKLSLIDLAGSERASVSANRGERLKEGSYINQSLLALANCINALAAQSDSTNNKCVTRVKYRDSKLTHILKNSLEGGCVLVMIANVHTAMHAFQESHNTLKYANRAKNIKIKNNASKNTQLLETSDTVKLVRRIEEIEQQLLFSQKENENLKSIIKQSSHFSSSSCLKENENSNTNNVNRMNNIFSSSSLDTNANFKKTFNKFFDYTQKGSTFNFNLEKTKNVNNYNIEKEINEEEEKKEINNKFIENKMAKNVNDKIKNGLFGIRKSLRISDQKKDENMFKTHNNFSREEELQAYNSALNIYSNNHEISSNSTNSSNISCINENLSYNPCNVNIINNHKNDSIYKKIDKSFENSQKLDEKKSHINDITKNKNPFYSSFHGLFESTSVEKPISEATKKQTINDEELNKSLKIKNNTDYFVEKKNLRRILNENVEKENIEVEDKKKNRKKNKKRKISSQCYHDNLKKDAYFIKLHENDNITDINNTEAEEKSKIKKKEVSYKKEEKVINAYDNNDSNHINSENNCKDIYYNEKIILKACNPFKKRKVESSLQTEFYDTNIPKKNNNNKISNKEEQKKKDKNEKRIIEENEKNKKSEKIKQNSEKKKFNKMPSIEEKSDEKKMEINTEETFKKIEKESEGETKKNLHNPIQEIIKGKENARINKKHLEVQKKKISLNYKNLLKVLRKSKVLLHKKIKLITFLKKRLKIEVEINKQLRHKLNEYEHDFKGKKKEFTSFYNNEIDEPKLTDIYNKNKNESCNLFFLSCPFKISSSSSSFSYCFINNFSNFYSSSCNLVTVSSTNSSSFFHDLSDFFYCDSFFGSFSRFFKKSLSFYTIFGFNAPLLQNYEPFCTSFKNIYSSPTQTFSSLSRNESIPFIDTCDTLISASSVCRPLVSSRYFSIFLSQCFVTLRNQESSDLNENSCFSTISSSDLITSNIFPHSTYTNSAYFKFNVTSSISSLSNLPVRSISYLKFKIFYSLNSSIFSSLLNPVKYPCPLSTIMLSSNSKSSSFTGESSISLKCKDLEISHINLSSSLCFSLSSCCCICKCFPFSSNLIDISKNFNDSSASMCSYTSNFRNSSLHFNTSCFPLNTVISNALTCGFNQLNDLSKHFYLLDSNHQWMHVKYPSVMVDSDILNNDDMNKNNPPEDALHASYYLSNKLKLHKIMKNYYDSNNTFENILKKDNNINDYLYNKNWKINGSSGHDITVVNYTSNNNSNNTISKDDSEKKYCKDMVNNINLNDNFNVKEIYSDYCRSNKINAKNCFHNQNINYYSSGKLKIHPDITNNNKNIHLKIDHINKKTTNKKIMQCYSNVLNYPSEYSSAKIDHVNKINNDHECKNSCDLNNTKINYSYSDNNNDDNAYKNANSNLNYDINNKENIIKIIYQKNLSNFLESKKKNSNTCNPISCISPKIPQDFVISNKHSNINNMNNNNTHKTSYHNVISKKNVTNNYNYCRNNKSTSTIFNSFPNNRSDYTYYKSKNTVSDSGMPNIKNNMKSIIKVKNIDTNNNKKVCNINLGSKNYTISYHNKKISEPTHFGKKNLTNNINNEVKGIASTLKNDVTKNNNFIKNNIANKSIVNYSSNILRYNETTKKSTTKKSTTKK